VPADDLRAAYRAGLEAGRPSTNGDVPPDSTFPAHVIPVAWWQTRPVLRQVYAWARSRVLPPDVLLAHVFAEIALRVPTVVVLPDIIGGPAALNFGAVVVAETGIGKSGARPLLHRALGREPVGTAWPLGTGEGLTEALLDFDDTTKTKSPHGRPVLVHADEGRQLEELIERKGSTLVSALCSAISGHALGQGNASRELRRIVPAFTYRLAVVVSVQPVYLRGILADVDGGLPQRFLFVSGTGHHLSTSIEQPAAPIELPELSLPAFTAKCGSRPTVIVPERVRRQIIADHVERARRADNGEPVAGESHRNLLRTRIAVMLALADGRTTVTDRDDPNAPGDWQLALAPVLASDATIARGAAMRAEQARQRALADEQRVARHAVASDVAVETNRVRSTARRVARLVREQPGVAAGDVRRRLSRQQRDIFDEALAFAIAEGWVVEHREPSHTGDDRRSLYPGDSAS